MSALALPAAAPQRRAPRAPHLQLVRPGFTPAPHEVPGPRPSPESAGPSSQVTPRAGAARPAIRLTARGRLVRAVLGLVAATGLAVAGGGVLGGLVAGAPSHDGPLERVSVSSGDTLWGIAAATAAEGQDLRDRVDDILRLNGLASGQLDVGQQLLVPAG